MIFEMFYLFEMQKQEENLLKEKIKKDYGCEKSCLDFNPYKEHIEKFFDKDKNIFIYKIVKNKREK